MRLTAGLHERYNMPMVKLDQSEEHCQNCNGTGQSRMVYAGFHVKKQWGDCISCDGSGKRLRCSGCKTLTNGPIIKHKNRPDLNTLCVICVVDKLNFKT